MRIQDDMARKRQRTIAWVVGISMVGLMFDGYDLVVYGTVVSTFLRDPTQLGPVDPALAGALGSYALLGVLFGALLAGTFNDRIGRRRTMLGAYAWFSIGMLATALTHSATTFGLFRFVTGLPMPETGTTTGAAPDATGATGYRGLFGDFMAPALLLGLMSATGLLLVYSLNTWLPELMLRAGFNAKGSLSFLVVLNGGAVLGPLVAARFADRLGPKPVVAASFLTGAVAILLLTLELPLPLLLCIVALAGMGTSGTQTRVRGASVGWCAGFGRLGGVGGPLIGGLLIGAGLSIQAILTVLAGLALLGIVLTLLVPMRRAAAATA